MTNNKKPIEKFTKYSEEFFLHEDKGNSLHASGKKEEAIECYDKAISINPNDAMVYCRKALVLSGLGRYEEAIECLKTADKNVCNM